MSQERRTEISELGEFGFIQELTQGRPKSIDTIQSVGDDCAVLRPTKENIVVTTDYLLEGIHFDLSYTPLRHLGYKSVVVNLSDVYAMNAIPKHITVSIAVSNRFSVEAIKEIYEGIYLACDKYNVDLVGGDTTSSTSGLLISVTAIGEASPSDIVYRHGAKQGDLVCVTGSLGSAFLGLQILIREKQVFLSDPNMKPEISEKNSYLIQRILKPEAKRGLIDFFASNQIKPTSMIDISDGLSSELMHICTRSDVGVVIEEANLPFDEQAYTQAMEFSYDPTTVALSGGEDYEMLFTISPEHLDLMMNYVDIRIIGEIKSKEEGRKLLTRSGNLYDLKAQGWVSF
jgi:thiamine-monophosphate kinase